MDEHVDPLAVLESIGVVDARDTRRMRGGLDTTIWRVERPDGACALRLFRPEQARSCRREVAAMRAANAAGVPAPGVLLEGTWQTRPVLLLTWVDGRPLADEMRARPWRAVALCREMGTLQARIHAVPAPTELIEGAGGWIDWIGPGEPDLRRAISAARPRGDALLHLDYHPLNVLACDGRVVGVIDWTNARAGDPRADVARTYAILRMAPDPDVGMPRALVVLTRRMMGWAWLSGYREAAGTLEAMAPFLAWAAVGQARDLATKVGKPGSWITAQDVRALESWAEYWRGRLS